MNLINVRSNLLLYYRVQVCDRSGLCSWSNEISVTTLNTIPTAVTLSIANAATSTIDLSWTQNKDKDFAYYQDYISLSPSITQNSSTSYLLGTATSPIATNFTITNLSASTTYYFKVYVCNTGGLCTGSNEVSTTTRAAFGAVAGQIYVPKISSLGISEVEPNDIPIESQYIDFLVPKKSFKISGILSSVDTDGFFFAFTQDMYVTLSIQISSGYSAYLWSEVLHSTSTITFIPFDNVSGNKNYSGNIMHTKSDEVSFLNIYVSGDFIPSGKWNYSIMVTTDYYRQGSRVLSRATQDNKSLEDIENNIVKYSLPEGIALKDLFNQRGIRIGALQPELKAGGLVGSQEDITTHIEPRIVTRPSPLPDSPNESIILRT